MKNFSGNFRLILLGAAIGLNSIVTFKALAQSSSEPDTKFLLKIKKETEVQDERRFEDLLKTFDKKLYKIHMVHPDGKSDDFPRSEVSIKTDKVTTSEIAKSAPAGEFNAIGSNVTQHLGCNTLAELRKVLDELK